MRTPTKLRSLIALSLLPLSSGCGILSGLSGACIYEIRSVQATGISAPSTGADQAYGMINVGERRDNDPGKNMYWIVTAPSLKGRVSSAEFKDSNRPSEPLFIFPIHGAERPPIVEGAAEQRDGANLNGFFDVLAGNRGVIELRTELADRPLISIPLTVSSRQDWTRPNCS